MKQVFTSEKEDQLFICLEKVCLQFKPRLLPRLFAHFQDQTWITVKNVLEKKLLEGEQPDYYINIDVSLW